MESWNCLGWEDLEAHLFQSCVGRDTSHCPRVLRVPSSLGLDTARDGSFVRTLGPHFQEGKIL